MVNQEGARRGLFGIGVRIPDRAVTSTLPPEIKPAPTSEPGKPRKEKTPSSKKALIARLAGSLLALTGIAGPAVDHHINHESELTPPAIGRDIASVPGFYWDLGKGTVEDVQRIVHNKNKLPEIPEFPTPIPPTEVPEIIVPEFFAVDEEPYSRIWPDARIVTGIHETGTVKEDVNTIPLTKENLGSIVASNPDSLSNELYALNTKYIFFPIKSDRNVAFETTIVDSEANHSEKGLIQFKGAGGTVFDLHNDDTVQLFVPKAEVFRFPPLIVEDKEYYHSLLIKETLPNGELEFYVVEIYRNGNALDVEIADEFKNAPIIQGGYSLRLWLDQTGQPASMTNNEDGTLTAPDLLKIKKDGLRLSIWAPGNTVLDFYSAVDENGNTKAVKSS